jgi:hypothetical protein
MKITRKEIKMYDTRSVWLFTDEGSNNGLSMQKKKKKSSMHRESEKPKFVAQEQLGKINSPGWLDETTGSGEVASRTNAVTGDGRRPGWVDGEAREGVTGKGVLRGREE